MRMVSALRHRGPDANGVWLSRDGALALGHTRLSILELSDAGAQPMVSADGSMALVFNGEIYNHLDLRQRLESEGIVTSWKGQSDTETLFVAIATWGIKKALEHSRGMFAFAYFDSRRRRLYLARDRFGEKPLYWSVSRSGLVFASELKSLRSTGMLSGRLSRDAAASLMRYNNIPAPLTVYEDVYKLQAGQIIIFESPVSAGYSESYWSVEEAWRAGVRYSFVGSDDQAVSECSILLRSALREQMVSDVPLGAFLSGGIDSSTIVALMQSLASTPIRTFSIGFQESGYNEAESALAVASFLGTQHTDLYVTASDALQVIPQLPTIYCEPFADSSQIPTFLLAKLARQHVKVALTGDAGDEVFGGYNRYLFGPALARRMRFLPRLLRKSIGAGLKSIPPDVWNRFASNFGHLFPSSAKFSDFGDKVAKVARALSARSDEEMYEGFLTQWPDTDHIVPGASGFSSFIDWASLGLDRLSFAEQMMIRDAIGYLSNDILVKVDRATMAASLESRAPFLDHRIYEFTASLPMRFKIRDGKTKWILRQILDEFLPRTLIERPKTGFGVPIDAWLRGELKDWSESLLSEQALRQSSMFDVAKVRNAWAQHLAGASNLQHPLWCVLMYQAWLRSDR